MDWGPKPFKVLNCCFMDSNFSKKFEEAWKNIRCLGWGAYILKEKLKKIENMFKGVEFDAFWKFGKK